MGLGSLIGGIIGGNKQKKAADKAAETALKTAEMNNALAREFRAENTTNLAPFMQRGDVAGAHINALLGLPGSYYVNRGPDGQPIEPQQQTPAQNQLISIPGIGGQVDLRRFLEIQRARQAQQQGQQQGRQPGQAQTTAVTPVSAGQAFDAYRNSNGYQFRWNEGMNALNNGYAAKGALRSGAAQKDVLRFGQGIASDEFGRYLGYLGNQQGVGLSGASAIAGVSQNALNNMTQNNNNASDARQNAYLTKGQINANIWSGVGSTIDKFASAFMPGFG